MQELEQRAAWDGKIFVDGGFRAPEGGATLTVLDKAAQEPIGAVGVASTADLDAAVGAAKAAQPAWAAEPYDVRAGILRAAAAALQARADEVASLIVRETGSIRGKADYEVGGAANELFEAAGLTSRAISHDHPVARPRAVQHRRADPARRRRRDHAVELPAHPRHARRGARARARQRGRAQAVARDADQRRRRAGRDLRRGRAPGRAAAGRARRRRASARRSSPTRACRWSTSPARPGPGARSRRSPAASSSTARSSSAATTRSSCSTTPTSTTRR